MNVSFLPSWGKLTGQNSWGNEQLHHHSHTIQYEKSLFRGHVGSSRALCQPDLVRWPLFFLWFLKYLSYHFHWGSLGVCWKLYHLKTKTTACRQKRHVYKTKQNKTTPNKHTLHLQNHITATYSLFSYLVTPVYKISQYGTRTSSSSTAGDARN